MLTYLSDANFQQVQTVLSRISQVKFPGPVDVALRDIDVRVGHREENLEKSVHEQYVLMRM